MKIKQAKSIIPERIQITTDIIENSINILDQKSTKFSPWAKSHLGSVFI